MNQKLLSLFVINDFISVLYWFPALLSGVKMAVAVETARKLLYLLYKGGVHMANFSDFLTRTFAVFSSLLSDFLN